MKVIILILVVLIILLIIIDAKHKESFEYVRKSYDVAILFTGYNIDEWDYKFIEKWHNKMYIYFIWNEDKNEKAYSSYWANKIKDLENVTMLKRGNYGWDATAWKDCILKYYGEISKYDEVFLINNSMNYEKLDMEEIVDLASHYDMYGIFYMHDQSPHIDSYFTGFNNKTINSEDFRNFFNKFPKIRTHIDAVGKYEMAISRYFENKGYKIGAYIVTKRPHTGLYMVYPEDVDLNDMKIITKKAHLKVNDNYNKWLELK